MLPYTKPLARKKIAQLQKIKNGRYSPMIVLATVIAMVLPGAMNKPLSLLGLVLMLIYVLAKKDYWKNMTVVAIAILGGVLLYNEYVSISKSTIKPQSSVISTQCLRQGSTSLPNCNQQAPKQIKANP